MNKVSVDIIVPTIRLDTKKLDAISRLEAPDEMSIHCYFVVDNPNGSDLKLDDPTDKEITVIRNETNLGGHLSRNKGLDAGSSEYVLFLDDDIEVPDNLLELYLAEIKKYSDAPGFVGCVKFPPCPNSFTKAAKASDILTFWDIADWQPSLAWGITANLMIKRQAIGKLRFSSEFPKNGGGEDVDFCLRIVQSNQKWFVSFPAAQVVHPWWGNASHQYRRFSRWAYGDSTLPTLHPSFKFRNAPNLVETITCALLIAILAFVLFSRSIIWFIPWLVSALALEYAMDGIRMKLKGKKLGLSISVQATSIRLSNDLGRIAGHIKNLHPSGITERFDYFMTREHIPYERKVASIKFVVFLSVAFLFFLLLR